MTKKQSGANIVGHPEEVGNRLLQLSPPDTSPANRLLRLLGPNQYFSQTGFNIFICFFRNQKMVNLQYRIFTSEIDITSVVAAYGPTPKFIL